MAVIRKRPRLYPNVKYRLEPISSKGEKLGSADFCFEHDAETGVLVNRDALEFDISKKVEVVFMFIYDTRDGTLVHVDRFDNTVFLDDIELLEIPKGELSFID